MKKDDILRVGLFPKTLHFGGGSWATAFHIGVVRAIEERWEQETGGKKGPLCENLRMSGDSAGAAIAAGWALGMSWIELRELYSRLALRARKEGICCGRMTDFHEEMMDTILGHVSNPREVLQERKFGMGVARFFGKYETYSSWRDMQHLRHCFHCSFHVPMYCAYQPALDGRQALDGGFANDGPKIHSYDLAAGQGDFMHIPMFPIFAEVVYPPSEEAIDGKIAEGYAAAMKYKFGTPPSNLQRPTITCSLAVYCFLRGLNWIWNITTQWILCGVFNCFCQTKGSTRERIESSENKYHSF